MRGAADADVDNRTLDGAKSLRDELALASQHRDVPFPIVPTVVKNNMHVKRIHVHTLAFGF